MTGRFASASLQRKMSVTLLAVMAVLVVLSYLILHKTVAPAFNDLEMAAANTNLVRAKRAIQNDLQNLAAVVGDWAPWDDAYRFARGENPGFEDSNLDRATLLNLDLDLLLIYDNRSNLRWGTVIENGEFADPAILQVFDRENPKSAKLIHHAGLSSRTDGYVRTALGPMLLSSRPIITSDKEGPIAGTMIMGQFFDSERLANLRNRTEVHLSWHPVDGSSSIPVSLQDSSASGTAPAIHHVTTDHAIKAYTLMTDLYGDPFLILQANTPRGLSALGSSTVKGAMLSLSIAGIIVAIVTWMLLRRIIVLPLQRLADHIAVIRRSGDLSVRLNEPRSDEIGALAGEFDRMTQEVHDARQLLLDQSFKAGKADTAAEVLHNIRNAMTPLINGIDRLSRTFRTAGSLRVQQATAELADPECPPDRRDKLLKYIESAFGHVRASGDEAVRDLGIASRQAHQVEAILADQEKYANVSPVIEGLELDDVVGQAALVLPNTDDAGIRFNMPGELKGFRVQAHRVGLLQVLGNLILNAYEAIQRNANSSGSIEVVASAEQVDDRPMVRVTVRDSGCGFDDDLSQRIFQRGFSSKSGQLSGLGLHWCANSLAGMGGRIVAESTGPGHGAAFHVFLPAG